MDRGTGVQMVIRWVWSVLRQSVSGVIKVNGVIGEGVMAEMFRKVNVCSGVVFIMGYLLVLGSHGGWYHVEQDDGRTHCLTKHVLSSENKQKHTKI